MIFLFAFGTVAAAMAGEWFAGTSGIFFLSTVPFAPFAVLWWLDRMRVVPRLFLAGSAGFVFDSMLSYPFGAYMICFFVISFAMEIAHAFFSGRDSRSARILTGAAAVGLFFACMPLAEALIRLLRA